MIKVRLLKFLRKYKFTHRLLKEYKFYKYSKLDFGLLSIIIPVYNVEKYLKKSILSVVKKQPYKNIEVICVEDCSTDNSKNILSDLAKEYKNIKVIYNKKNIGAGLSRNKGIKVAKGKWITFLDPDDTVYPFHYSKALSTLNKTGSDFSVSGNSCLSKIIYKQIFNNDKGKGAVETNINLSNNGNNYFLYNYYNMWAKIFQKKFFDKYINKFPSTTNSNDVVPSTKAYINSKQISILKYPAVNYNRLNTNSISNSKSYNYFLTQFQQKHHAFNLIKSAKSLNNFTKNKIIVFLLLNFLNQNNQYSFDWNYLWTLQKKNTLAITYKKLNI